MDPLSIAGLTIAVFDELWKLGEATAELLSTYRAFDLESKSLEAKTRDEIHQSRALRLLLFQPSPVRIIEYNGEVLFEQFDAEVQNEIQLFLEELCSVVDQAHRLLSRPLRTNQTTASGSKPTSSISRRLRWTLLDKKRITALIEDFSELNGRILANIKLWCLSVSIGVNLQHLRRLEHDPNSRQLGFDIDARLRLAANHAESIQETSELKNPELVLALENAKKFGDKFGILEWNGKPALVEFRSYASDAPIPITIDSRTRELVDNLAKLLHQPKELVFRTPSCIGWTLKPLTNQYSFIFALPPDVQPVPISLLEILSLTVSMKPSLGDKFRLALGLARCVSQLQLVKWVCLLWLLYTYILTLKKVHESFRSANILFFPGSDGDKRSNDPLKRIDLSQPWILGFDFSRPESYFSYGIEDPCPSRDIYRHPERQQSPSQPFKKLHDIYALGVVLLEIGLWQPALSLEKDHFKRLRDPSLIKKCLTAQAEKRLSPRAGEKYKAIVLKCLNGDFNVTNDTKEDSKLQREFRTQVVDVLEKAANSI
ncbi:MAG: hypothetical protein M1822_004662 [Bathelium mastoideum]|nr:MAG: hypothetical protein M1822_004662 [Bathelium mastoideum]